MKPKTLTDEEIWKIWLAIEPDPKEQDIPSRELEIWYVRSWLGPGAPIDALEGLAFAMWKKGEHELAGFLEQLALSRRKLN
jgi:hypothetical protein